MLSVPSEISSRIRQTYPTIEIAWSNKKHCFEVMERYNRGAISSLRHIWDYENPDGSKAPIIGDRVMEFLQRADTRKWPLHERFKLYDKEWKQRVERTELEFSDEIQSKILEDYRYIAGIPTFFMNPKFHFKATGEGIS